MPVCVLITSQAFNLHFETLIKKEPPAQIFSSKLYKNFNPNKAGLFQAFSEGGAAYINITLYNC